MEPIVNKTNNFADAAEWDLEQHLSMSPQERMKAARALKARAYPADAKDVRECHR